MNAREKDLLKFVGKAVACKGLVITNGRAEYKSIVFTCVGYALDCGYLIVDAGPTGHGHRAGTLDPVFDVVVYPCERCLFVHPDKVEIV